MQPTERPPLRALVIDDDPDVATLLATILRRDGFEVSTAFDGEDGVAQAQRLTPDLVILDLVMPKLHGTEVCARIRSFSDPIVIMLTGQSSERELLAGLAVGADDYMTKPFSAPELVARIHTVMRRARKPVSGGAVRTFEDLTIDLAARHVELDHVAVQMTKIEFDLLAVLSSDPSLTFDRATLVEQVWGSDWVADGHMVDVHMANVRRKLGDDPKAPRFVHTVRGVGFRMGTGQR